MTLLAGLQIGSEQLVMRCGGGDVHLSVRGGHAVGHVGDYPEKTSRLNIYTL